TGELLEQVLNNPTEDNLLVIGILASQTASNLGLEVWDPKCWVWREAFGSLLMNMAQVEGISLPLPPEADASPPKTEAPPAEDSTTPDAPAVEGEQPTTP
ncbi:hypothetical protein HQ487_04805, partial [Candidatus Uhrbacteria bacterium]|nr:hypothetical protein [Candidatus Uhrbacteria bacterium]